MTKPRVIRSMSAADFASIADEFANKDGMIFEIHAIRAERDALDKEVQRLRAELGMAYGHDYQKANPTYTGPCPLCQRGYA